MHVVPLSNHHTLVISNLIALLLDKSATYLIMSVKVE